MMRMSANHHHHHQQLSLVAVKALTTVTILTTLLQPSLHFTLVRKGRGDVNGGGGSANAEKVGDAISVHGKLAPIDNGRDPSRHHPLPHRHQPALWAQTAAVNGAGFPIPDSTTDGLSTLTRQQTQPANWRKTNTAKNSQITRRLGQRPKEESESLPKAEDSFDWREEGGPSTALVQSSREQLGAGRSGDGSGKAESLGQQHQSRSSQRRGQSPEDSFIEVVEVDFNSAVDSEGANSNSQGLYHPKTSSGRSGGDLTGGSDVSLSVSSKAVLRVGRSQQLQQQQVPQPAQLKTHVPKMILTAVGSVTAIFGVCVMAAIFQCCCRRKRSDSGSEDEGSLKKEQQQQQQQKGGSRSSRSKSPSPQKVLGKDGNETDTGESEQDKLLVEDEDLGDFSAVQRETPVLRSYRKPPPPKNRARASRVPRALKTVDPKASPDIFQELVENEESEAKDVASKNNSKPLKPANGLPVPETTTAAMHSSMLADIDDTLAALHHADDDPEENKSDSTSSPSKDADRSREPSAEKVLAEKTVGDNSNLKSPPSKEDVSSSLSREDLAKVLSQELSRSVSKELLSKPRSKTASPMTQSKQSTPKSQSAGASPKLQSKDSSASQSKNNVSSANNGSGGSSDAEKTEASSNKGEQQESGNIFALIDPTVKDKGSEAGEKGKSKIPVRAASSPTQPTAPLRPSSVKEKRFPVPSVHGDQMDQLLKSLKTRLKEDGSSPKRASNKVSPEVESTSEEDLDPQARDRSHSDPTKQQEEKQEKFQQTHL